jgi:uncharacterized phage protein gp47/JayE
VFTVDQITQNIVNQLRLLDPAVSAEVGTPERKIIEATAEMIASSQVDFTVLNQQHDIDSMSGGRLDAYLSIFNFSRQQAVAAYGTVTFSRNAPASNAIVIPMGTQVQALIDDPFFPTLTYVTVQTVILEAGETSVDAPIQCTVAGSVGNIDAGQITGFGGLRTVNGITGVTNQAPVQGGQDSESDAGYKTRFQNTFLRNISGTTDMFLALAVAQTGITKANVVGPQSRYQEYVQVPTARDAALGTVGGVGYDPDGTLYPHKRTSAKSGIPYSKYTWPQSEFLTDGTLDPATAVFYRPEVDYIFNSPPIAYAATGTNEVQTVTRTSTGGTYKLSFRGVSTGNLDATASGTAAGVQTALRALSTIGGTNVNVSGSNGGPYTVTFVGELAGSNVPALVVDAALATGGTVTVATTTPGVAGTRTIDTPATSPNVTFLNPYDATDNQGGDPRLAENNVLLLEHAYMSVNSRNDPSFGVLNCVDLFVDGENIASAASSEILPGTAHDLQNTNTVLWTYQKTAAPKVINFRRKVDSAACDVGNRLQPLYWQPVVDLPNTIVVGTATFYRANYWNPADSTYYNQKLDDGTYHFKAHYATAIEVNSHHGSVRARNGIEWFLTGNNHVGGQLPGDGESYTGPLIDTLAGSAFVVDGYLYDKNISDLQGVLEGNKQVTQDVLAHRAKLRYFRPVITVMYTLGATKAVVDAAIAAQLSAFFQTQYFGSAVQLSDILQMIHNTPGVDNVRWTNDSPGGNKMEEVGADGSTLSGGPFWITTDFYLQDNELPASPSANAVTITVRAQNTWGT